MDLRRNKRLPYTAFTDLFCTYDRGARYAVSLLYRADYFSALKVYKPTKMAVIRCGVLSIPIIFVDWNPLISACSQNNHTLCCSRNA